MKILSWNVQGIGNTWTFNALKSLLRRHDPDIIFIIESKLMGCQAERLVDCLNFENWWAVDRVGMSGGLLLIWKTDVTLKVLSWSCGHIAALVAGTGFSPWLLTGFYGHPDHSKRLLSWELLHRIKEIAPGPWLCVGDFNEICCNREKVGGNMRSDVSIARFRRAIDDCNLMDFGNTKGEMTWYGRGVMERLDRALCNQEWIDLFPKSEVQTLDWLCSDHRPILVSFKAR